MNEKLKSELTEILNQFWPEDSAISGLVKMCQRYPSWRCPGIGCQNCALGQPLNPTIQGWLSQ